MDWWVGRAVQHSAWRSMFSCGASAGKVGGHVWIATPNHRCVCLSINLSCPSQPCVQHIRATSSPTNAQVHEDMEFVGCMFCELYLFIHVHIITFCAGVSIAMLCICFSFQCFFSLHFNTSRSFLDTFKCVCLCTLFHCMIFALHLLFQVSKMQT